MEQSARHPEKQGDSPSSQPLEWFPEPPNEVDSEEDSSERDDSEATEEDSCDESVSGESIYSSTEDEDFDLCSEEVSGFPGDEKQGEVNSITKEKEDSLPTSDATGQRDDTTLVSQAHEVHVAAPKGQESGAASEDQVHDALPQAKEDAPTGPVYVIVLVALIFQSLCVILLLVAMVIIALAGGFTGPPVVNAGPAINTLTPTAMLPALLTNTRSLSPGICKQPVEHSLPDALVAHIAQVSPDTPAPQPEMSHDTSIAVVYRFDFDVCKVTVPWNKNDIASILPEVHFSPPLPPLGTPAQRPPTHIAITALALLVPTYESVCKSPAAAARARINWGDHPVCPVPPPSREDHTSSTMTCNTSLHTNDQTKELNTGGIVIALNSSAVKEVLTMHPLTLFYSVMESWCLLKCFLAFNYQLQPRPVRRKRSQWAKHGKKHSRRKGKGSHQPTCTTDSFTSTCLHAGQNFLHSLQHAYSVASSAMNKTLQYAQRYLTTEYLTSSLVSLRQRIRHSLEDAYTVVCLAFEGMRSPCTKQYFQKRGRISTSEDTHGKEITSLSHYHSSSQDSATRGSHHSTQASTTRSSQHDIQCGSDPPDSTAPGSHSLTCNHFGSQHSAQEDTSHGNQPDVSGGSNPQVSAASESLPSTSSQSAESPAQSVQDHKTPDHHLSAGSLPSEERNHVESSPDEREASSDLTTSTDTSSSPHTPQTEPVSQPASQKTEQSPNHSSSGHLSVQDPTTDASLEQNQMKREDCPTVQEDSSPSSQLDSQCSVERQSPSSTPHLVQDHTDLSDNSPPSDVQLDHNRSNITAPLDEEKTPNPPTNRLTTTCESLTKQSCEDSNSSPDSPDSLGSETDRRPPPAQSSSQSSTLLPPSSQPSPTQAPASLPPSSWPSPPQAPASLPPSPTETISQSRTHQEKTCRMASEHSALQNNTTHWDSSESEEDTHTDDTLVELAESSVEGESQTHSAAADSEAASSESEHTHTDDKPVDETESSVEGEGQTHSAVGDSEAVGSESEEYACSEDTPMDEARSPVEGEDQTHSAVVDSEAVGYESEEHTCTEDTLVETAGSSLEEEGQTHPAAGDSEAAQPDSSTPAPDSNTTQSRGYVDSCEPQAPYQSTRKHKLLKALSWIVLHLRAVITAILSLPPTVQLWMKGRYLSRTAQSSARAEGGSTETEEERGTRGPSPSSHLSVQEGTGDGSLTTEQHQTEQDNHGSSQGGTEQGSHRTGQNHVSYSPTQDGTECGTPHCGQNQDDYLKTEQGTPQNQVEDSHQSTGDNTEHDTTHSGKNHGSYSSALDVSEEDSPHSEQKRDYLAVCECSTSQKDVEGNDHQSTQGESDRGIHHHQMKENDYQSTQGEIDCTQHPQTEWDGYQSTQDERDRGPHCHQTEQGYCQSTQGGTDRTQHPQTERDGCISTQDGTDHASPQSGQTQRSHPSQKVMTKRSSLASQQNPRDGHPGQLAVENQASQNNQPSSPNGSPPALEPQRVCHSPLHPAQPDTGSLSRLQDQTDSSEVDSLSRGPGKGSPSQCVAGLTCPINTAMFGPMNPLVHSNTSPIPESTKPELVCGKPTETTSAASPNVHVHTELQQQPHSSSTTAMNTSQSLEEGTSYLAGAGVKEPYLQDTSSGHQFKKKELSPLGDHNVFPLSSDDGEPESELASAEMEEQLTPVPDLEATFSPSQDQGEVCSGELVSGKEEQTLGQSCGLQDMEDGESELSREDEGGRIMERRTQELEEEGEVEVWKEEGMVEGGTEGGVEKDAQLDPNAASSLMQATYSDRHQEPLMTAGEKHQSLLAHLVHEEQWKTRKRLTSDDTHKNASPSLGVEQDQLGTELATHAPAQKTHDTYNLTTPTNTHDDSAFTSEAVSKSHQTGLRRQDTEHARERKPKTSTATLDSGVGSKTNTASHFGKEDSLSHFPQHLAPVKHPPDYSTDEPPLPPTTDASAGKEVQLEVAVQQCKTTGHPLIGCLSAAKSSSPSVPLTGHGVPSKRDHSGHLGNQEVAASLPVHGNSDNEAVVVEETATPPSSSDAVLAVEHSISPVGTHSNMSSNVEVQPPVQTSTTSGLLVGSSFYPHDPIPKKFSHGDNVHILPFDGPAQVFTILVESPVPDELCTYTKQYQPPLHVPQPLFGGPLGYNVPQPFLSLAE